MTRGEAGAGPCPWPRGRTRTPARVEPLAVSARAAGGTRCSGPRRLEEGQSGEGHGDGRLGESSDLPDFPPTVYLPVAAMRKGVSCVWG